LKLVNGNRVIIIGGGPAGSFAAIHVLRFAAEAGLRLDVTIFEGRDFSQPGTAGCNRCAGILSPTLLANVQSVGLNLPEEVIQAKLDSYVLYLGDTQTTVHQPDQSRGIVAIYRGSGPQLGARPFPHSFDNWLLEQAAARGAKIQPLSVKTIQRCPRPVIITANGQYEADFVILATGANARPPLDASWQYHSPATETMLQGETPCPANFPSSSVQVLFGSMPGLIFGSLIPKGRYVSVSLLGHKLPADAINTFLKSSGLAVWFKDTTSTLCMCTPKIVVSAATGYYDDRFVAIGDAAISRYYKDGIGTAYLTAEAAAWTAIHHGVAAEDFAAGYSPLCRRIAVDNHYGRLLFQLWGVTRRMPVLLNAWQKAVLAERDRPPKERILTRVLWGMFTGDETYRELFWLSVSWPAVTGLLRNLLKKSGD
jgi:flavin-dependent dehydrogenase